MQVTNLSTFSLEGDATSGRFYQLNINDPHASHEDYRAFFEQVSIVPRIELTCHNLTHLPEGVLDHVQELQTLAIVSDNLVEIPDSWFPSTLRRITIKAKNLRSLPDCFEKFTNLNSFSLESEDFTDLRPICKPGLQIAHLHLNLNRLTSLPSDFSNLKVVSIRIEGQNPFKLGREITEHNFLQYLDLRAPLGQIEGDLRKAERLINLTIRNIDCEDLSALKLLPETLFVLSLYSEKSYWYGLPEFENLTQLKSLFLTKCGENSIPESIGKCASLRQLTIYDSLIETLPDELNECLNLENFMLSNGRIKSIEPLCKLPNIKSIKINNNSLESIPKDWSLATNLTELYISNCRLEINDLSFVSTIKKLKAINLTGNTLTSPEILLTKKAVPFLYPHRDLFLETPVKYANMDEFLKLCSAIARTKFSREDQLWFLEFFRNSVTLSAVGDLDQNRLLQASNINHAGLRKKIQSIFDGLADREGLEPGNADSLVYVSGKTKLKKTEVSKMLSEMGIAYSSRYSEDVSHVILGVNCPDYDIFPTPFPFKVITEVSLQQLYTQEKPKFLQTAESSNNNDLIDKVSSLLQSPDSANKLVALGMLEAGGIPQGVVEDLIVLQKTTDDSKVRKKVSKIVQLHASEDWLPIVRDKLSFKNILTASETKIYGQLSKLAGRTSFLMTTKLSLLLFKHYKRGLRFALRAKGFYELNKEALKLLFDGTHFDYSRGVGYKNWKGKDPKDVIMYSHHGIKIPLPLDALELGKIESLNLHNCKYSAVPKEIVQFKDLKKLDLSHNYISKIPGYFTQLSGLEELDISFNRFEEFPERLTKLPKLKVLHLSYNMNQRGNYTEKELVEAAREKLPNCQLIYSDEAK